MDDPEWGSRAPIPPVGRVLGTEDSTPLAFWVGLGPGEMLQLDDVVACERALPGDAGAVKIYGVVSQVRARHVGARYDSDVWDIAAGVLPAEVVEAAQIDATRFEPEVFVPPLPGTPVRRAEGLERDEGLFFDGMTRRLPAGLTRDDEPLYLNIDFVDGTRGAHVNISGVSGVATKTTYGAFLLQGLFNGGQLGDDAHNARALIFNVKGEDLLFLDKANKALTDADRSRYAALGLPAEPFASVGFYAPPRRGDPSAAPDVHSRVLGVRSYWWTLIEFCQQQLLAFLFAEPDDDRQQFTMVIQNVAARLKDVALPSGAGSVTVEGEPVRTFQDLCQLVADRLDDDVTRADWAGRAIGAGTTNAFVRRLYGCIRHVQDLIRGDVPNKDHTVELSGQQVTVVDLHTLHDRAKRFVVGVTIRQMFDQKEREGRARPLQFLVLDELNKYAPRQGYSPIKEILLDVAERGRSLGIILIGAQQTASEVERRIVANSSVRVVGRLDAAEAGREEYGFLPAMQRQRATILKPGTMIVSQPELPLPLVARFPFPSWATRSSEAVPDPEGSGLLSRFLGP